MFLRLPVSAMFKDGDSWAVYVVEDGTAQLRTINIGQRNGQLTEVLGGLEEGDTVIMHPSDKVLPGATVIDRQAL